MNRRIYKLLLFCMVSMLSVFVHAANTLEVTYQIGNTQGSLNIINVKKYAQSLLN